MVPDTELAFLCVLQPPQNGLESYLEAILQMATLLSFLTPPEGYG